MKWESPSFVEVKMDAEIGSYQDDFEDVPDVTEQTQPVATQINERSASQVAEKPFGHLQQECRS